MLKKFFTTVTKLSLSLTLRQNKLECQTLIFINCESGQCISYSYPDQVSQGLTHNYSSSLKNVPRVNTLAYLAVVSGAKKKVLKEFYETFFLGHSCQGKISQSVCPWYVLGQSYICKQGWSLPEWSSIIREGSGLAHNYQTSMKKTFAQTLQLIMLLRQ